jgi:hypothetical protein
MLPHISQSAAGVNKYDPVYNNLFEVYFTIPQALQANFGQDVAILTQQVQSIGGLATLDKGPDATEQKFMGTSRSYLNSKLDNTYHELTVKLALNLRNRTDNFVYNLFRAWNNLCYDKSTGITTLKGGDDGYSADWMKVVIANRGGDIFRQIIYKDIFMVSGISGFDELNYESQDLIQIEVKFRSDWADDRNIGRNG